MLLAVHVAALGAAAALVILSGRSLLCTDASGSMSHPSEVGVAGRRRRPSRPGDSTSAGGRTVARARAPEIWRLPRAARETGAPQRGGIGQPLLRRPKESRTRAKTQPQPLG